MLVAIFRLANTSLQQVSWSIWTDHDHLGSDVEQDWSYTVFAVVFFFFTLIEHTYLELIFSFRFLACITDALWAKRGERSRPQRRRARRNGCFRMLRRTRHFARSAKRELSARRAEEKNKAPVTSPFFWLFGTNVHALNVGRTRTMDW